MIDQWLKIPYVKYGRDQSGADCWGLVRIVRRYLRGDALPMYSGRDPDSLDARNGGSIEFIEDSGFSEMPPVAGSVVFCYRANLCIHAGIIVPVNGRLMVLDTSSKRGPLLQTMRDFSRDYRAVKYYDNYQDF